MDLSRFSVCVLMICQIGTTHPSGNEDCLCSQIPKRNFTKPPQETCSGTSNRFRYSCIDNYVRKAGTSNLLKCQNAKWNVSTLECIPDPKITTTTTTTTTTRSGEKMYSWVSAKPSTTTHTPHSFETSSTFQTEGTSASTDRGTNETQNTSGTEKLVNNSLSSTSTPVPSIRTNDTQKDSCMNTFLVLGIVPNVTSRAREQETETMMMDTGVGIGLTAVACSTIAIIIIIVFILYKRRRGRRQIPTLSAAEMEPMNNPSTKMP